MAFVGGFIACIITEIVAAFTWAVVIAVRRYHNEQH